MWFKKVNMLCFISSINFRFFKKNDWRLLLDTEKKMKCL